MSPHEQASARLGAVLWFVVGLTVGAVLLWVVLDRSHQLCRSQCVELVQ